MKLKNTFLILFLCCTSLCFAQDKLFEKYADMDNVTSVFISKRMLRTLKGCSFPSIPSSSGLLMRWSKTRPMPKISCKMPTISCGVGGMN